MLRATVVDMNKVRLLYLVYSDLLRAGSSEDPIPVGARFSAPIQTGPGAHPVFFTVGTASFPGVKAAGA
jgi:hypothetical protein